MDNETVGLCILSIICFISFVGMVSTLISIIQDLTNKHQHKQNTMSYNKTPIYQNDEDEEASVIIEESNTNSFFESDFEV